MKIVYSTREMIEFIKHLLSLPRDSSYFIYTMDSEFELKFTGDLSKVRKAMLEWLETRREN